LIVFPLSILYWLCYLRVFVHVRFSQSQLNSCCFKNKVRNVFFLSLFTTLMDKLT
jgi:hypothetical protein